MLRLRKFLNINALVLVGIGLASFVLNNVADAIFYMVVALLIRQGLDKYGR